jgi:glyoxylase-like metal-dependent hydrolase (beta-lactamase superfamily II)
MTAAQKRLTTEKPMGERVFECAPGVFRIALPTAFPVGDVNAYFLPGPEPVLVDTGVRGEATMAVLSAALGCLGARVSDVRHLLLTHGHVDHSGGARAIREASGCDVRLHPRGHGRVADPAGRLAADLPGYLDFLRRCGFSQATVELHGLHAGWHLKYADPCVDLAPSCEGDVATTGDGRRLRCVETPGHSGDHVAWLIEGEGVLLTGDHVLPAITSNPTLEAVGEDCEPCRRPLVAFRESLRKVAAMPVEVACPGHGRPFGDLAGRCAEIEAHQARRCEHVLARIREAGAPTRKALALLVFGKVPPKEVYLALSEIQAAIGLLEDAGRVRVVTDGPIERLVPL